MHHRRLAIEAHEVTEHLPEFRAECIARLRKKRSQARASPLDARCITAYRKRHRAGRRRDAQLGEQGNKLRVRAIVVNQKARIDGSTDAVDLDIDSMGMASQVIVGLE